MHQKNPPEIVNQLLGSGRDLEGVFISTFWLFLIRRGPGGKTVEGAVGRTSERLQALFRKYDSELICEYK